MTRIFLPIKQLFALLLCLLILFTVFRLCFLFFNASSFPGLDFQTMASIFWHGLRFDLSAIVILNSLFLFLFLLPISYLQHLPVYRKILKISFLIPNILALLFEVGDWLYFPFNHKRSTAEVFYMVTRKGDFLVLLPSFLKDYWYAFVLAIIFILILVKAYHRIDLYFRTQKNLLIFVAKATELQNQKRAFGIRSLIFLIVMGLSLIGIRGGLQLVPINIRNAVEATKSEYAPLVLNTPFSLIHSIANAHVEEKHFMEDSQAYQLVQPVHQFREPDSFDKKNVVVIILESFSKEFTKLGPGKSYTPFLDSLMDLGLTFTNAFANGLHSAEGIPAIISGIPSLMDEAFSVSAYSTNSITSFPFLLKPYGYHSSFFHGATNGSMSFDVFAKSAGYDQYFGRTEYNKEQDYDGSWGIFDEPFLQFYAQQLATKQQPFFSTVFTVTSHSPYPIPSKYKGKFPNDGLAVQSTISYTDMALRRFFAAIKGEPWFQNTLFVFAADHCSPMASNAYYANGTGRYEIPILFYAPGDFKLKGENNTLMQQIDILPSVMDYLKYPKPFFALGNSVFKKDAPHFIINQLSGVFHWIYKDAQMMFVQDQLREVYAYPSDSLRETNLLNQPGFQPDSASIKLWQAFVQVYNHALIQNKMKVKP